MELEEEIRLREEQHKHLPFANYVKNLRESRGVSLRDLPNYDPETDTLISPHNIYNPETGMIENPDAFTTFQVLMADLVEGLVFGRDLFTIDDVVETPRWTEVAMETAGEITGSMGLLMASTVLAELMLLGTLTSRPSQNSLISRLTQTGVKEAFRTGLYYRFRNLMAPEENQADDEEVRDTALYAVSSGVGRVISSTLLNKVFPGASLLTERVVSLVGGTLFGHLGNFYKYEDAEDFVDNVFSTQLLMYAVVDMVLYTYRVNKVGTPEHVAKKMEDYMRAVKEATLNPSEANQGKVYAITEELLQFLTDEKGSSVIERTFAQYGQNLNAQAGVLKELLANQALADTFGLPGWESVFKDGNVEVLNRLGIVANPQNFEPVKKEDVEKAVAEGVHQASSSSNIIVRLISNLLRNREDKKRAKNLKTPVDTQTIEANVSEDESLEYDDIKDVFRDDVIRDIAWDGVSEEEAKRLAEATPRKGAVINTARLDTSPESRKLVEAMAELYGVDISESHDVTKAKGKALLENPEEFQEKRKSVLETLGDAKNVWTAVRMINASSKEKFLEMVREQDLGNLSDEELTTLLILKDLIAASAGDQQVIGSLLGQGLNAGNIVVGGQEINLFDMSNDDLRVLAGISAKTSEIIEAQGGRDAVLEAITKFISDLSLGVYDVGKAQSPPKKSQKVSKTVIDSLVEWRRNNLVSALSSKVAVLLGQGITTGLDVTTHYLGALWTPITRRIIGPEKFGDGGISFREANARALGYFEGTLQNAIAPFATMEDISILEQGASIDLTFLEKVKMLFTDPKRFEDYLLKTSSTPYMGYAESDHRAVTAENWFGDIEDKPLMEILATGVDYFGAMVRLQGFGTLDVVGRYAESSAYYAELNGLLARLDLDPEEMKQLKELVVLYRSYLIQVEAWKQGIENQLGRPLTVEEKLEAEKEFMGFFAEGALAELSPEALTRIKYLDGRAMDHARKMTWRQPFQTKLGASFEQFLSANNWTGLVIPFFKTHLKQVEVTLESLGASSETLDALLGKVYRADGTVDREKQMLAFGRMTLALGLLGASMGLFKNAMLSPRARTPEERRTMMDAGIPEASLRIGDKWVPLDRMGPLGMILTMGANLTRDIEEFLFDDNEGEATISTLFATVLLDVADILTRGPAMQGLRGILDVLTGRADPEKWVDSVTEGYNPLRGVRTTLERYRLWGLNPFYREYLSENFFSDKPKLDTFGKPISNYKHFFGVQYYELTDSPIRMELLALDMSLPPLVPQVYDVTLTDEEFYELQLILANEVQAEERLNEFIQSPAYQRLPSSELKRDAIRNQWQRLKTEAKNRFIGLPSDYGERRIEALDRKIYERFEKEDRVSWIDKLIGVFSERGKSDKGKPEIPQVKGTSNPSIF